MPPTRAARSGRHRTYPTAPAATTRRPSAMMRRRLRLAIRMPPVDQMRRKHREQEIYDCQEPKAGPSVRHLPQARTELVDAHDAVDREIGGKDLARGEHRPGDRLARPGESGREELRQAGRDEDQKRHLWALEPGAYRLSHKTGRENEHRR